MYRKTQLNKLGFSLIFIQIFVTLLYVITYNKYNTTITIKAMKAIIVKSTKQLKAAFPSLSRTDKFKRTLDVVFEHGFSIELKIADDWKCFTHKASGRRYRSKIVYDGTARYMLRTKVSHALVSEKNLAAEPECFQNVEAEVTGEQIINGSHSFMHSAEYEETDSASWAQLARIIGKLIKSDLIDVCECSKCGGSGILPQFMYYAEGICFQCMGIGKWFEVKK